MREFLEGLETEVSEVKFSTAGPVREFLEGLETLLHGGEVDPRPPGARVPRRA